MMKKILCCVALGAMTALSVQAQNRDGAVSLDNQFVIYKWYQNGRAHYGKAPPRGVRNYVMLNEYGMEITKERPYANEKGSNILRPVRPEAPEANTGNATNEAGNQPLPEGSISREQRCEVARERQKVLTGNKSTVYEDDGNGNLVPLTPEAVEQRKKSAEKEIADFCN